MAFCAHIYSIYKFWHTPLVSKLLNVEIMEKITVTPTYLIFGTKVHHSNSSCVPPAFIAQELDTTASATVGEGERNEALLARSEIVT